MAEKVIRRNRENVYWSELDRKATGEDPDMDAYVPGVSDPGNRRPSRVRGRMTREVKAKIPIKQPVVEDLLDSSSENQESEKVVKKKSRPGRETNSRSTNHVKRMTEDTTVMSSSFESLREKSMQQLRQITLKDLRAEDKQRVANLVRELARVGEEKEKAISDLHGEREHYETQMLTLVQQQEKILREREDVQEKLFLCQKLLTEYQAQLLNKEEKINAEMAAAPEAGGNPTNRKSGTRSTNQNLPKPVLTNQEDDNDSVTDLLLADRDPAENIKRPYSSMIDKEIARERSLSRSSRGSAASRSRSVSPLDGRPRFTYPQKLDGIGIGPLPEPVASSTHKSMDINSQISHNQELDSPRSSVRGSSVRNQSPCEDRHKRKIAFNEETIKDSTRKLSPSMKGKEMFNDPEYASYYKKLSPSGRKRELLRQRQALLDEQERLKQVLNNQERQLKVRQYEYQKREELQKQRMEFYKEGGKFPALKLDFDTGSTQGTRSEQEDCGKERYNTEVGHVITDRIDDLERIESGSRSERNEVEIDDEIKIRSRVSAGTSPIASPRNHTVSIATSEAKGQGHRVEVIDDDEDIPRLIDVATSISYRSPLQDASNRQGNLPLCTNRQKLSPKTKQGTSLTPRSDPPMSARTPGDKTLNVLDIVNSMEESPSANDVENHPMTFTPNKYLIHQKGNQKSPYRGYASPAQPGTSQRKPLDNMEESVEENRILEDIFFL